MAQYLPVASRLMKSKYAECDEFRRQLYMVACVASSLDESIKKGTPSQPVATFIPRKPDMQFLVDIGVIDCHVLGKGNPDAWDVFLENGCRVKNVSPINMFGLTYAELEQNYVAGKKADIDKNGNTR